MIYQVRKRTEPEDIVYALHLYLNEYLKAKIITIQYQPLDIKTGKAIGDLTIMKEWEPHSSERYIIESFKRLSHFTQFYYHF